MHDEVEEHPQEQPPSLPVQVEGVGGGGLVKNQQLVDWKWVIDVSLWGVIHGLHHFLPHLLEAEESHVMSTASVAGLMAVPGLAPYNAAKFGVVAIMETLHHEISDDVQSFPPLHRPAGQRPRNNACKPGGITVSFIYINHNIHINDE